MDYGVVFPTLDIGTDPIAIRDYTQAAEELGYKQILIYDHVVGTAHGGRSRELTGPYDERHPFHEAMVLLGFVAACTSSIGLTTGVLVLPQRQTALVAKQAAEIALLSEGRLTLGVGIGWNHVEYEALGMPFSERGRRLEEQVQVLRLLWENDLVDYTGDYHRIDRGGIAPRPDSRIPIWFGGSSDAALRRAARMGDGFLVQAGTDPLQKASRIQELLDSEGSKGDFDLAISTDFIAGPDSWIGTADQWESAGGTLMSVRVLDTPSVAKWYGVPVSGLTTVEDHIRALERFIETVPA